MVPTKNNKIHQRQGVKKLLRKIKKLLRIFAADNAFLTGVQLHASRQKASLHIDDPLVGAARPVELRVL